MFYHCGSEKKTECRTDLRLPLVNKRVNIREEVLDCSSSNLLGTIKLPQNISMITERLPGAKYHQKSRSEPPHTRTPLPQIVMLNRGITNRDLSESKIESSYLRHSPERSRYEHPSQIRNILRENYGALKLPRVKYPQHVNSIGEEISNNNIRRREEFLPPQLPERSRNRRQFY